VTASAEPLTVGDRARPVYTLRVAGVLTDATVACTITRPDGTTFAGSVSHDGLGLYSAEFTVNQPGLWLYLFTASGAAQDVTDGTFLVRAAVAAATGYCTVGEVRAQLGDDDAKLDQTLLERAVAVVSRAVDEFCSDGATTAGRRFWQDLTVKTRTYRCEQLDRAWIDDISTLTGLLVKTDEDGDGVFETTWTLDSDFQIEPLNADADGGAYAWWELSATGERGFPGWPQRAGLQLTARWGWSQIPEQVNQAAILKAVRLFLRKDSPDGWTSGMADFGPVRISRYEDPDVAMLLDPFVKRRPSRTLRYQPQRWSLFHQGRR